MLLFSFTQKPKWQQGQKIGWHQRELENKPSPTFFWLCAFTSLYIPERDILGESFHGCQKSSSLFVGKAAVIGFCGNNGKTSSEWDCHYFTVRGRCRKSYYPWGGREAGPSGFTPRHTLNWELLPPELQSGDANPISQPIAVMLLTSYRN